jgi:hypothetical protein
VEELTSISQSVDFELGKVRDPGRDGEHVVLSLFEKVDELGTIARNCTNQKVIEKEIEGSACLAVDFSQITFLQEDSRRRDELTEQLHTLQLVLQLDDLLSAFVGSLTFVDLQHHTVDLVEGILKFRVIRVCIWCVLNQLSK